MRFTLLVVMLGAVACGGEDALDLSPDGAVDAPSIDAVPPAFVGRWRQVPLSPTPEAEREVITMEASGRWTDVNPTGTYRGTWSLTPDDRLATTFQDTVDIMPYHVTADRFMRAAYAPEGAVDGVVGTWKMFETNIGGDLHQTMVIDADGTVTITYAWPDRTTRFDGTWQLDGAVLRFTGTVDGQAASHATHVLPGVLGYPLYERLP